MDPVLTAALTITLLFVFLLAVKPRLPGQYESFCTLCAAVSITWFGLLVAYWTGSFPHPELVAVLMGSTVLGLFYELENRSPTELKLFRLPAYLSLIVIAHSLLMTTVYVSAIGGVLTIWLVFGAIYLYREHDRMSDYVDRLISCCKEW